MSDNIPFELQAEIMKRLPVKSLLQFRSVSKPWKSLIDSPNFIACYNSQKQHLLVRYADQLARDGVLYDYKYVSIVDDHTFPQHKVSLNLPAFVKMLRHPRSIGISHGLLCLYGCVYPDSRRMDVVVLWNISIRKTIAVVVPNVKQGIYATAIGFGVCREISDPKIVKVTYIDRWKDVESVTCIPCQVEVFTLSTGTWRSPYSSNLPRKSIQFSQNYVVVDGFIYWLASDRIITMDGRCKPYNLIISFDVRSEEFREVNLPDDLARLHPNWLSLSKVSESLVVVEQGVEDVWVMQDGVPKSFTKLFNVNVNTPYAQVSQLRGYRKVGEPISRFRGFRRTNEPIIETVPQNLHGQLVVYEPGLKHVDKLVLDGIEFSFSVYPYMETLLLHDQPRLRVFRN